MFDYKLLSALAAVVEQAGFERAAQVHDHHHPIWIQLTIIPFVIALLHVVRLLDSGQVAAPEDLALHDHRLQIYGVIWVALFAIGVYG